jgi:hypothetical protein
MSIDQNIKMEIYKEKVEGESQDAGMTVMKSPDFTIDKALRIT